MSGSYVANAICLIHVLSWAKITQNHFIFLDKEIMRFYVPVTDVEGMNVYEWS